MKRVIIYILSVSTTIILSFSVYSRIVCQNCHYKISSLDSIALNFELEAAKRGQNISLKKESVILKFGKLKSTENAFCKKGYFQKVITIDSFNWKNHSRAFREYLVFHELGHCVLNRSHDTNKLILGECKSWMREDNSQCGINFSNKLWRQYYIDELFNQTIIKPSWYNVDKKSISTSSKNVSKIRSVEVKNFHKEIFDFSVNDDWIIELISKKSTPEANRFSLSVNELRINGLYEVPFPFKPGARVTLETSVLSGEPVPNFGNNEINFNRREYLINSSKYLDTKDLRISLQKINGTLYIFINNRLVHVLNFTETRISTFLFSNIQSTLGVYLIEK